MIKNSISLSILDDHGKSLPHMIANHILKKIFIGELPQGSRIIESDMAKELNVSSIPVREAFYILENTGVIQRLPRIGVRVKSITEREMNDYTEALIELFTIGINYSKDKWNEQKRKNLHSYFKEAEETLKNRNIIDYVLKCDYTCQFW
jgi:DNA-binding GntR family transcriptional regulator